MWLLTPAGFFSIVQKPADAAAGTLTVRARVASDLDNLRKTVLPTLGPTLAGNGTDYAFRATAPKEDVARALGELALQTNYSNFKNEVAKRQGKARAALYEAVWNVLNYLQIEPGKFTSPTYHPRKDEHGKPVVLKKPSTPTSIDSWNDAGQIACVVPDGAVPQTLNDIALHSWNDVPTTPHGWEALAQPTIEEPEFITPGGYKKAAGVVVCEPDGRVWVVAPSNAFGGYQATFPKGTIDKGMSAQATALMEAYEESGLRVRLLRHLVDVKRSLSFTRYYLAERIGGNPADMGWESQAVMLVPRERLASVADHKNDQSIIEALGHE